MAVIDDAELDALTASPATAWRGRPPADLLRRTWDEETVVFNKTTGSVHLLDAVAGDVVALLSEQHPAPATIDAIASRLFDPLGQEPLSAADLAALDKALLALVDIGLVFRVA